MEQFDNNTTNILPIHTDEERLNMLALNMLPDIGPKRARFLLKHFGTAGAALKAPLKALKQVEEIGEIIGNRFEDGAKTILEKAKKEMAFAEKNGIRIMFFNEEAFPHRLLSCADSPYILYAKGPVNLNAKKVVSIVGTRKNTEYGQRVTEELVSDLASIEDIIIVSGLAVGIDGFAHRQSMRSGIPTVGVLAHGLDMVYPPVHKKMAQEMIEHGGLLTEFPSGTAPEKEHFPLRNRIVAGISDVTVLAESDIKGGAMITAYVAAGYNRDVAAFPGRKYDGKSLGCNHLIKTNVASLITSADDLLYLMNWSPNKKKKPTQTQLLINLTPEEQTILEMLQANDTVHADELYHRTGMNNSQLAIVLLDLEMRGLIKSLPGKHYRMN